jgi:hypothetical protein
MTEKSEVLAVVSVLGLIAALLVVATMNRPVINVPATSPMVNVYANITNPSYPSGLSVTGNADIRVEPDEAVVYIDVITENKTAMNAKDLNAQLTGRVIAAISQQGIPKDSIETASYRLSENTEWDSEMQKNVATGYKLTNTLRVTVGSLKDATTNVDSVGRLIDAAVNAGANGINQVTFRLSKGAEKKLREQLLLNATEDARKKAQEIARSLGLTLDKIDGVMENNYYYSSSYDYYDPYRSYSETGAYTEILPQMIEVTSSITVSYRIK